MAIIITDDNIDIMEIQQKNAHYVHAIYHPHSQRTIIKSFHSYEKGGHLKQLAIVNHNSIQIYRNVGSSIVYERTHNFICDISVMEVMPVKGETSDIIFLGDELGRFMLWSPLLGTLTANNVVRSPEYLAPFYQRAPAEEKQAQFSGIYWNFNSFDTEAVIFFTVSTKIILLKLRWSKNKISFIQPPQEIQCPYQDVSFIGIIRGKEPYIGIVEQREQKTFLRLHNTNSTNFECNTTIQKSNLSSFYVTSQVDQIITVTNSELSIYNIRTQQALCNFQISESGFVSSIGQDLYLYVGEQGSQMIVFSKKKYKNYGSFMIQNQMCMKLASHGMLSDGGFLVSVIDQGHTVEFIALYEQSWRSIRSIFSTATIFSIQDLGRKDECLAVVKVGENVHHVGVLSKRLTAKLQKETVVRSGILALFTANKGKAVILSCADFNTVLIYDEQKEGFEVGFEFQSGAIVKVLDKYVVMQKKIYEMDLINNSIKQLWVDKSVIVGADFDGKFIGFQCLDFNYKFYNTETREIDRVRKNCCQEYIWKFYSRECLLVGGLDMPGKLKVIPVFREVTIVQTYCNELISDIIPYGELLVISFSNCQINIYLYKSMNIIQSIDCSSQPLRLLRYGKNILGYGYNESYIIQIHEEQKTQVSCEQVEFDSAKENVEIVYLESMDKFMISHQQSLGLYSICNDKPKHSSLFRVIWMNIGINNDSNPPFATVENGIAYIAYCYEVTMKNVYTAQLLKKQSHCLKQVCCIQKLEIGLLVIGIDDMQNAVIFVFDYKDLQIIFTESLSKKSPTAVKRKGSNSFFLREQNIITLYEIKKQLTLKEIFTTKIGLNGYILGVQPQLSMVMASDPLRYLVVYDYRLNKLVSLCRYQNLNNISDANFLQCSLVVGDSVGTITIVEFNFDKGQVLRTTMSQVASLKIGSQITHINKINNGVIYSTLSGSVGKIVSIEPDKFYVLKQAEKEALSMIEENKNELKYQEWVNRASLADKLIDGFLIQSYLSNKKTIRDTNYKQVLQIWKRIK